MTPSFEVNSSDVPSLKWSPPKWTTTHVSGRGTEISGAGNGTRTRDPLLGKQMLYH